jgi:Spx/MgsR family transcriptional regulator
VAKPLLIWKKTCSTCRTARQWMQGQKASFEEREINADPLSAGELDALIGTKDYVPYLNTRNELYRERDMKTKKPSREEALKLMAGQPNLMKRPILVVGREQVLGFDEKAFREALK